jgi:hypothetical protein
MSWIWHNFIMSDMVEFPIASDLIAEIEALIDMLEKEEKKKEKEGKEEKKEGKVGKKKKEEITVGAGGSSIGSDIDTDTDEGSSSDKEEGSEGSSESESKGSSSTGTSSGSGTGTTAGETDIPLPYLSTFETYTDIPWTENDKNEIARMILNYAQLRGRRCKVYLR